jgi:hypothetical protein
MNQQQNETSNEIRIAAENDTTRRSFGKAALWVAPALTVMFAASAQPAKANIGYQNGFPS